MSKKTLAEKMETMTGYCSSCGAEVIDLVAKKFLPNYTTHIVELSDGTIMKVGVCTACKLKLTSGKNVQKTADAILNNHKTYWSDKKARPRNFKDLMITDPNTSFEKNKIKKMKAEHKKKLEKIAEKEAERIALKESKKLTK